MAFDGSYPRCIREAGTLYGIFALLRAAPHLMQRAPRKSTAGSL